MNKIFKNLITIISLLAGIAAIISLYFQINSHKPIIEIKSISIEKLTESPIVDGLKAVYTFKGDTVNSLWKLHYLISNNGDEIIIGEGNRKNIIKNNIKFELNKKFKILEFSTRAKGLPIVSTLKDNKVNISFLQWKPQETFELVLYAEQIEEGRKPVLTTNEREILNGEVKYTTILKQTQTKNTLFDKLPKPIRRPLWWIGIVFFGLIVITMPIVWITELIKVVKYNNWKKTDYWMYKDWIEEKIKEGKLKSFKSPKDLPDYLWVDYPYIKPVFPDNSFGSLSIAVIVIIIFFSIPLLLLIEY